MAKNPEFESKIKRNQRGEFSEKEEGRKPTVGGNVELPYEESETPGIHELSSHIFNNGRGVKETTVTSGICPDDTIRIDFEDGHIIMGGFDPDYPSCFTFSEYGSQEELDETMEASTDTYDFEGSPDPYAATKYICGGLSDSALKDIAESSDPHRKVMAARDSQTSPELLAQLSCDENDSVRSAVASRVEPLPDEALHRLVFDDDPSIRSLIADRRDAPANVLDLLSRDENEFVRQAVAENRATPAEVFVRLSEDKEASVRRFTARNPSAPNAVLEHLARDEDGFVSQYACDTLRDKDEETYSKLALELNKER